MNKYKIADLRLAAAASFGRSGKRIADIGTDHASLPIFLVGNGFASYAVACDINKGPLSAAKQNISAASLSDRIDTMLTDGLKGIDVYAPEDIYILGMGGELIWRIISDSAYVKQAGIRLILQPMTHARDLRYGLYSNGFDIVDETLIRDRDRVYQIIVAEYDGIIRKCSEVEMWLGKKNLKEQSDELSEQALLYAGGIKKKIDGCSGNVDPAVIHLYEKLRAIVENRG